MDKGYNPRPILYFACGKLADYRELDEVLEYYKWKGIGSSVIILDEATSPEEWYRYMDVNASVGVVEKEWLCNDQ